MGDVHAAQKAKSRLHWNVAAMSFDENENVACVAYVVVPGPPVISVSGLGRG